MSQWVISSVTDIRTYIANVNPEGVYTYEGGRLVDPLVDAIRAAEHPAYGTDWVEWLDEHAEALAREMR